MSSAEQPVNEKTSSSDGLYLLIPKFYYFYFILITNLLRLH